VIDSVSAEFMVPFQFLGMGIAGFEHFPKHLQHSHAPVGDISTTFEPEECSS
jgi:hypothetical protein